MILILVVEWLPSLLGCVGGLVPELAGVLVSLGRLCRGCGGRV
jgi:hypothetical protein